MLMEYKADCVENRPATSFLRAAPLSSERRSSQRFCTLVRVAKVVREGDMGLWRVRNISDTGLMLMSKADVTPGEPLSIFLSDTIVLSARVLWCDGNFCGVKFNRPINSTAILKHLADEQRDPAHRPPRLPISRHGLAYCDRGIHAVKIFDVSQFGIGIEHHGCFEHGMAIKLLFESGLERRGVVRWSKDGRAGISLVEPFKREELESARSL